MQFKFGLGEIVEDIVTGFKGVVTSRCEYLNGCRQYGIRPQALHEGKRIDAEWIDEGQLRGAGESVVLARGYGVADEAPAEIPGGPRPHPPSDPSA